jgi:hypothetical protein
MSASSWKPKPLSTAELQRLMGRDGFGGPQGDSLAAINSSMLGEPLSRTALRRGYLAVRKFRRHLIPKAGGIPDSECGSDIEPLVRWDHVELASLPGRAHQAKSEEVFGMRNRRRLGTIMHLTLLSCAPRRRLKRFCEENSVMPITLLARIFPVSLPDQRCRASSTAIISVTGATWESWNPCPW